MLTAEKLQSLAFEASQFTRGFSAVAGIAAVFDEAASAVQAYEEANAALAGVRAQINAADAALAQRQAGTTDESASIIAEAHGKAAAILAQADETLAAAQQAVDDAVTERDAVKAELDVLQPALAAARAQARALLG